MGKSFLIKCSFHSWLAATSWFQNVSNSIGFPSVLGVRAKSPFHPQQPCTQKRRIKRSSFSIAECSFLCILAIIAHVVFAQLFLAKKYRSWGEPCATPSGVSTRITGIAPYLSSGSPRTASISMRTKQLAASVCVCGLIFPSTAIGKRAIEKESLACTKFCVKREARKDPNSRCRVSRLINLEESPLTKKNFRPAHLPALREDS